MCDQVAAEKNYADGETFQQGNLEIDFSRPVPHGPEGTKLGNVLMTAVHHGDETFVHTSDVQGPVSPDSLNWILKQEPDLALIGGPPSYLVPHKVDRETVEKGRRNSARIAEETDVAIDHHTLRETEWRDFLQPVFEAAEQNGNTATTGAGLIGKEKDLLEARRKALHEETPVPDEFYDRIEEGHYLSRKIPETFKHR